MCARAAHLISKTRNSKKRVFIIQTFNRFGRKRTELRAEDTQRQLVVSEESVLLHMIFIV